MSPLRTLTRGTATTLAALAGGLFLATSPGASLASQTDTIPEALTCADVLATPSDTMAGMDHGEMDDMEQAEFDLMYIDMMIPHHESVVALATVASDELAHSDLVAMADEIIGTQDAEIQAMRELRAEWYPEAPPVTMDQMMAGMPGMGTDMELMDQVMSAEWQVRSFCAAEDKDLAFIDQVIPHHQMAIDTSEDALEMAVHPELVAIAELVIEAQEQEIADLDRIRAELTGESTPAS